MSDPSQLTRREAIAVIATTGAVVLGTGTALAEGGLAMAETTSSLPPAYRGDRQPKPLPFDPAKLSGLSEKLLRSHHENNYTGAVKRLNQIREQLGQLPKDGPPYQTGALKREELIAANSMVLHELYFANLGGDGKASGTVVDLLKAQYGTMETWEQEFRQTGMSLGGGSGWVVLAWDAAQQAAHTHWFGDHTHGVGWGTPLLVMDMYEHAYAIDYATNARGYVDAFFRNLNWDAVNQRAETARRTK